MVRCESRGRGPNETRGSKESTFTACHDISMNYLSRITRLSHSVSFRFKNKFGVFDRDLIRSVMSNLMHSGHKENGTNTWHPYDIRKHLSSYYQNTLDLQNGRDLARIWHAHLWPSWNEFQLDLNFSQKKRKNVASARMRAAFSSFLRVFMQIESNRQCKACTNQSSKYRT